MSVRENGWSHAYRAYASVGKWIARTWALFVVWIVTYALLFLVIVVGDLADHWIVYFTPLPILVHALLEPWLIKHEAKTFGEAE